MTDPIATGAAAVAPAPARDAAAEEPSPTEGTAPPAGPEPNGAAMVETELLVEEISIDGMCGVY